AWRFVLMTTTEIGGGVPAINEAQPQTLADHWILSRLAKLTLGVTRLIDEFQLGEAGRQINDFFWSDYCDWYVQIAKVQMQGDERLGHNTSGILRAVLDQSLRLLHPYMPFVTEEVWQHLYRICEPDTEQWPASALIVASWPRTQLSLIDEEAEQSFGLLQEIIVRIRDARNQLDVEPARRVPVMFVAGSQTSLR